MEDNVSSSFAGEILKITFYLIYLLLHLKRQARHVGRSQSFLKHPKLGAHGLCSQESLSLLPPPPYPEPFNGQMMGDCTQTLLLIACEVMGTPVQYH